MGILITRLQQEKDGYFMPVVLFCGSDSELNHAGTIILGGFRFNVYIIIYAGSVFFGTPCIAPVISKKLELQIKEVKLMEFFLRVLGSRVV